MFIDKMLIMFLDRNPVNQETIVEDLLFKNDNDF